MLVLGTGIIHELFNKWTRGAARLGGGLPTLSGPGRTWAARRATMATAIIVQGGANRSGGFARGEAEKTGPDWRDFNDNNGNEKKKWAVQDSNPGPFACKANALAAELPARGP